MPLLTFGNYEVEPTHITFKGYEVISEERCTMYSVYRRSSPNEDGHRYANWVADFEYRSHAAFFANQLAQIEEHFV